MKIEARMVVVDSIFYNIDIILVLVQTIELKSFEMF